MLEFLETHRYQQYRHRGKYADLHQHKRNIHSLNHQLTHRLDIPACRKHS